MKRERHVFKFRGFSGGFQPTVFGTLSCCLDVREGLFQKINPLELFSASSEMMKILAVRNRGEIGITAGSDAHTPYEIGNVWIEADVNSPEQLRGYLITGKDIRSKGKSSSPFYTLLSGIGKFFVSHNPPLISSCVQTNNNT